MCLCVCVCVFLMFFLIACCLGYYVNKDGQNLDLDVFF